MMSCPCFPSRADFQSLVNDLIAGFEDVKMDYVAGLDALGFILGTSVAQALGVGLITVRKGGKLPADVVRTEFIDYTGQTKALEMRKDVLPPGSRVLDVDDWIETGAQVSATIRLIEQLDSVVVGIAAISMDDNEKTRAIGSKYKVMRCGHARIHTTSCATALLE